MWNNNYNQYPYATANYNAYNTPYQSSNQLYQQPSNNFQYQQGQTGQMKNNIIWVQGKENARSMQLQPNSTVILLDTQSNKFYIKTTDEIGLGKIRIFNYTEEQDSEQNTNTPNKEIDLSNYVTRQQLEEILSQKENYKNEQSVSTVKF